MPEIDRRRALKLFGTASTALVAGCQDDGDGGGGSGDGGGGSGDGGDADLGERVPTLVLEYWTGHSSTPIAERGVPLLEEAWTELGIDVELQPKEIVASLNEVWGDARTSHIVQAVHSTGAARIDPHEFISRYRIDWAGGTDKTSYTHVTDCEATDLIIQQSQEANREARQELINQIVERLSEQVHAISQGPVVINSAFRNDRWNIDTGNLGGSVNNPESYITAEPTTDDDTLNAQVRAIQIETGNMFQASATGLVVHGSLIHSPLLMWDNNGEVVPMLAEDLEEGDDGQTFTFTMHDDATFHNGDPITPDDVKATFELLAEYRDEFPYAPSVEYEYIEARDDEVEFKLTEPFAPFLTREVPRWGIVHMDSWEGLRDDPQGFEPDLENLVGSGPFQVDLFEPRSTLGLAPFENHPVYSPSHRVALQGFEELTTATEAMIGGELDYMVDLDSGNLERLEDSDMAANLQTDSQPSYAPDVLWPHMAYGPTKHRTFRDAIAKAIDYEAWNEIARGGKSEPDTHATGLMRTHPWRPPEDRIYNVVEDPSGDIDLARQVLEENGWGWDSDGRLHYPPDADLTPVFPQGERPSSEHGFECLDESGNYVGT